MKRPHRAYIGLGSNLHQPELQLQRALRELARAPQTELVAHSRLYRTAPLGCSEPQPDYLNAVAEILTSLAPEELLGKLQDIEARHGRRPAHRNAPRVLDLDLLLYDQRRIATARLQVPHPRMTQRAFVLAPLLELCPDIVLPTGESAAACLAGLNDQRIERLGYAGDSLPQREVA